MCEVNGIDMSIMQGVITADEWEQIALRGTRFVIAKCGNGNNSTSDPQWKHDLDDARGVGLKVGVYHFPFLGLPVDPHHPGRGPEDQAKAHFEMCDGLGSDAGDLPACADLEWPDSSVWGKPIKGVDNSVVSQTAARDFVLRYLAAYDALQGRPMLVYGSPWFLHELALPADVATHPLWLACYAKAAPQLTPPWTTYSLWQTGGGSLLRLPSGVPVDTDVCESEKTFQQLLRG